MLQIVNQTFRRVDQSAVIQSATWQTASWFVGELSYYRWARGGMCRWMGCCLPPSPVVSVIFRPWGRKIRAYWCYFPSARRDVGYSVDQLCHPRSDAYSAGQVLLNKQQIWCGGANLHCYRDVLMITLNLK